MRFTGHERDVESGLDYMLARYCGPSLGTMLSVDPASESVYRNVPQTWNRYAYTFNNPTNLIDPDGEAVVDAKLHNSGANNVPNPSPSQDTFFVANQLQQLGKHLTNGGTFFAVNIEFIVDQGDSPSNYTVSQEAYTIDRTNSKNQALGNAYDDPAKSNQAVSGQSLFSWDAPGGLADIASGETSASNTVDQTFIAKTYAVDKNTGQQSGPALYWFVLIVQNSSGKQDIAIGEQLDLANPQHAALINKIPKK